MEASATGELGATKISHAGELGTSKISFTDELGTSEISVTELAMAQHEVKEECPGHP